MPGSSFHPARQALLPALDVRFGMSEAPTGAQWFQVSVLPGIQPLEAVSQHWFGDPSTLFTQP